MNQLNLRASSTEVASLGDHDQLSFDLSDFPDFVEMSDDEKKIFFDLLLSRPADQWRRSDVTLLVQATKISIRLTRILDTAFSEGMLVPGSTGNNMVANPLFGVYTRLIGVYGSLMNKLQLSPEARGESTGRVPKVLDVTPDNLSNLIPQGDSQGVLHANSHRNYT